MEAHIISTPNLDERAADYKKQIEQLLEKTLQGFIGIGQLLDKSRIELGQKRWLDMVNYELPFTRRTAEKLIRIAKDGRLTDSRYVHKLPPHWTSLHELTYLSDEQFERGIAEGVIRPDAERKEITVLKKQTVFPSLNNSASRRPSSTANKPTAIDLESYNPPARGNDAILAQRDFSSACVSLDDAIQFERDLKALCTQYNVNFPLRRYIVDKMVLAGIERRLREVYEEFKHGREGNSVAGIERSFFEMETRNRVSGKREDSDHFDLDLDELYDYCVDLGIITKYTPVQEVSPNAYVDLMGWRFLTGAPKDREAAVEALRSLTAENAYAKAMLDYIENA